MPATPADEPQPPKAHLPGLDLLRAAAIAMVLLFHYSAFFAHPDGMPEWVSFGWTGVDLFFVLSGYLISSQLLAAQARGGISLKSYFIKRSFRILPLYWLTLLAYLLMPSWRERESLAPLWKYLTFTQNLYFDAARNGTFSHAWSLCIEEQFYLVLPLILLWLGRRLTLRGTLLGVAGCMVLGFGIRWFSWEHFVALDAQGKPVATPGAAWSLGWARWIYYCTQTRLDGLLTGVGIASLFQFRGDLKRWCLDRPGRFAAAGAAGLWWAASFSTPYLNHGCALYGYPLIAVSYGCLLIAVVSPRLKLPAPVFFPIRWLATLSYGIYLTHKMVGHVTQRVLVGHGIGGRSWGMLLACFAAFVGVGVGLHWLVERPLFVVRDWVLLRSERRGKDDGGSASAGMR
jgi:peptidoglycan/LPS O-acetylase OafA/YrhL